MSVSVSLRLPDDIHQQLEVLTEEMERSKTYIIVKALESYFEDYEDYRIALARLNDKDAKFISSKEMKRRLEKRK